MKQFVISMICLSLCLLTPASLYAKETTTERTYGQISETLTIRLAESVYEKSIRRLFENEKDVDGWITYYIDTGDGVVVPGSYMIIQGQCYEYYTVCNPGFCREGLRFLFTPGGKQAWARLGKYNTPYRFFGNPDKYMKEAIKKEKTLDENEPARKDCLPAED